MDTNLTIEAGIRIHGEVAVGDGQVRTRSIRARDEAAGEEGLIEGCRRRLLDLTLNHSMGEVVVKGVGPAWAGEEAEEHGAENRANPGRSKFYVDGELT